MSHKLAIGVLLVLALGIRLWDFPPRHELRHVDEMAYLIGGLHLLEGMTPPYKYSPAAPQTWATWLQGGLRSAKYVLAPTAEERAVDARVRPFVAVNHAIWDYYADLSQLRWVWLALALPVSLWALVEAYLLGRTVAGLAGGVLAGGLVALLPIFVQLSGEGRPYMMGWAFGIIALSLAIRRSDRRGRILSAVAMGLAIASRIDMLLLMPIVWSELWAKRTFTGVPTGESAAVPTVRVAGIRAWFRTMLQYHLIAGATTVLVAPWILTTLIGNMRIIATVRLSQHVRGPTPFSETLRDIAFTEGMWLVVILAIVAAVVPRRGERFPRVLLAAFLLMLIASMFKATGFGLQHQGGPLVAVVVLCVLALRPLERWGTKLVWAVVAAALLVPAVQAVRSTYARHRAYVSDDAAMQWLEANVPAGTRVYCQVSIQNPLPTREASDALWAEVTDGNAWQKKFLKGLERFHMSADEIPRALSEENMVVERATRRMWFILGSRKGVTRPRYDIRAALNSPIYGVQDLKAEFARTGGVILWRSRVDDANIAGLTPAMQWLSPDGENGVFIFRTPEVTPATRPTAKSRDE